MLNEKASFRRAFCSPFNGFRRRAGPCLVSTGCEKPLGAKDVAAFLTRIAKRKGVTTRSGMLTPDEERLVWCERHREGGRPDAPH